DEGLVGLPGWDGPRNNVRHFEVAQYLLDGWTPILLTQTVLFMLRNDLVATMPAVPHLSTPPQTTDLAFSGPSCRWGDVANFLDSRPTGQSLSLPVVSLGNRTRLELRGWSYDPATHSAPSKIVITIGDSVVASVPTSVRRPDIAALLRDRRAATSGYDISVVTSNRGAAHAYALGSDGTLHPVGHSYVPPTGYVQMPHGPRLRVTSQAIGSNEIAASDVVHLAKVSVPLDHASFKLATFSAPAPIGVANLELTDTAVPVGDARTLLMGNVRREITANVLPVAGSDLAVRVGSCLQWHGYTTKSLYLVQSGGVPITGLRLSGVRD
ncbi:MAG: hypothetical protein JWO57_392, partial [Pseudonocardiales bacterium]|nr:hypothetical protein [Pseudonocardiales bacterium]